METINEVKTLFVPLMLNSTFLSCFVSIYKFNAYTYIVDTTYEKDGISPTV